MRLLRHLAASGLLCLSMACGGPAEPLASPTAEVVPVAPSAGLLFAAPRRLARATVPPALVASSAGVPVRVAQRCSASALPPGTVSLAAAWAGRGPGFYALTQGPGHATLIRLTGSGCELAPWLGYFQTEVAVTPPLLAAGRRGYAFVVEDSAVHEVSARGVETTAGPFRNVSSLAVSPSERRLVVSTCGAWQVLERQGNAWEEHTALTQAARTVDATGRALPLDDERLAILDEHGVVRVVSAAGVTATFDATLDGEKPSTDSLALCVADEGPALSATVLCLSYPERGVSARWTGEGALVDVITVAGLAPEQRVTGVVKDLSGNGGGVHVLLRSAAGLSLAYLPEP